MRSVAQMWKQTPSVVIRIVRRPGTASATPLPVTPRAQEPVASLVTRIFAPAAAFPRRRVLFAAADSATNISAVCEEIGDVLSQISGARVALVQSGSSSVLEIKKRAGSATAAGSWRSYCSPISEHLWRVPSAILCDWNRGPAPDGRASASGDLQAAFEYFVVAAPAADGETSMLSSLCDGTVLVLSANRTRREAALRAKEQLLRHRAPLLGAVLEGRIFPIPEAIYRRL